MLQKTERPEAIRVSRMRGQADNLAFLASEETTDLPPGIIDAVGEV